MMGFGANRAKIALIEKTLDEPIPTAKKQGTVAVSEELIQVIVAMGFTEQQAKHALTEAKKNPDRAVDFLFKHPEIDDPIAEAENKGVAVKKEMKVEDTGVYRYKMKGVVVHLGRNYSSGHYVCYTKKDGKWIYYNDTKVAESTDPAIGKGVLFLLERSTS